MKYPKLFSAVYDAHKSGARRECASTQILKGTFQSNGGNGLAAAIAASQTLGGLHAPIVQTMQQVLRWKDLPCETIRYHILDKIKLKRGLIYGFGSSFVKRAPDPSLQECDKALMGESLSLFEFKEKLQDILLDMSIPIYPNLAFYSACLFHLTNRPYGMVYLDVVQMRLPVWSKILSEQK